MSRQDQESWFNTKKFDKYCKNLVEDKIDLTKFARNLGISYSTLWTIRDGREPTFSVIAKLVSLTGTCFDDWIRKPRKVEFGPMEQLPRGRKRKVKA